MLAKKKASTPPVLRAAPLERLRWLVHGFSTRRVGSLGFTEEETRAAVQLSRASAAARSTDGVKAFFLAGIRPIIAEVPNCRIAEFQFGTSAIPHFGNPPTN